VAVTLLDDDDLAYSLSVASRLRRAGIPTETAMVPAKLGRQLKTADRRGAVFAVIAGGEERRRGAVAVKHLPSGTQAEVDLETLVEHILTLEPQIRS
jgi:histidyl-tRNA synthetase